jgi:hypothetical protein
LKSDTLYKYANAMDYMILRGRGWSWTVTSTILKTLPRVHRERELNTIKWILRKIISLHKYIFEENKKH